MGLLVGVGGGARSARAQPPTPESLRTPLGQTQQPSLQAQRCLALCEYHHYNSAPDSCRWYAAQALRSVPARSVQAAWAQTWLASAWLREKQFDSAAYYLEAAAQGFRHHKLPEGIARVLTEQAALQSAQDQVPAARQRYQEALAYCRQHELPTAEADVLRAYSFMAMREQQLDSAALYNQTAEALYRRTEHRRGLAHVVWMHGLLAQRRADYAEARVWLDSALALADGAACFRLGTECYTTLANVQVESGDYVAALATLLRTAERHRQVGHTEGMGQAYLGMGNVHYYRDEYPLARRYYLRALEAFEATRLLDGLARGYGNLAAVQRLEGDIEGALRSHERSLQYREALGNQAMIAHAHTNLANLYLDEREDLAKARHHLELAEPIVEARQNAYDRAYLWLVFSQLFLKEGKITAALQRAHDVLSLAHGNGIPELELETYVHLQNLFAQRHQFDSAYHYLVQASTLRDTLLSEENSVRIAELETRYQTRQKDDSLQFARQSVTLLGAEAEVREARLFRQRWLSISALALVALLGGWVYTLAQTRRQLQQQREALATTNRQLDRANGQLQERNQQLDATNAQLQCTVQHLDEANRQLQESNQTLAQQKIQIETLMREQSHRLKNHLSAVAGLLTLQSHSLVDPSARQALEESHARVEAIMLVQQMLYGKDLTHLPVDVYLTELIRTILRMYGFCEQLARLHIAPLRLPADQVLHLGLLVNELVTNAAKYALPTVRDPALDVGLQPESAAQLRLWVSDNGPGFVPDTTATASFGLRLVALQTRQLEGQARWSNGQGMCFTLEFPHETLEGGAAL
ncbi:Two-component sensor histidine kinase, contains HisKA and HATPase domains [Catalinimonas alkaloidigena]|uniref:histidine kinase n=2 Tax=Catalinimonas alkaloidigena TaxID=1075417 RepID=A0A1G9T2A8_9BACT|nr:Two-component sensor histidine kinase, contains HisKA and HATPase domains [Catalinimonas alkaloidigena]